MTPEVILSDWLDTEGIRAVSEVRTDFTDAADWLEATGILIFAGKSAHPLCQACETPHRLSQFRDGAECVEAYCHSSGWIPVDAEERDGLAVNVSAFLRIVAKCLETDRACPFDRFETDPGREGRLFDLGHVAGSNGHWRLLFYTGRLHPEGYDKLVGLIRDTTGCRGALILTLPRPPMGMVLPNENRVAWWGDVLSIGEVGMNPDPQAIDEYTAGLRLVSRQDGPEPFYWPDAASDIWRELHRAGKLTTNQAAMGRSVHAILRKRFASESIPENDKAVSDKLHKLHRDHYPTRKQRMG